MEIPKGAKLIDISAHYNQQSLPNHLKTDNSMGPATWVKVVVEEGFLDMYLDGSDKAKRILPESPGIIPNQKLFRFAATGKEVKFYLEYYHEAVLEDGTGLAGLLGDKSARL